MAVNSWAGDFGYAEGAGREEYSSQRRARIRGRFEFHRGATSGADDLRAGGRFIDLEPIEAAQAEAAREETAAQPRVKTYRGNIINIQI